MLNGNNMNHALKSAFESGYSNAVVSLSKLTSNKIHFNHLHSGSYVLESSSMTEDIYGQSPGTKLMLTTEVFGDVTGRSYLLLSDSEFDLLTSAVPDSKTSGVNLKEEFIKEVDNILSASVITQLSNILGFKMYGDIPILAGKVTGRIIDIIIDDFGEELSHVYVSSIRFSFDDHPEIRPLFVWVMDDEVLSRAETKTIL